MEKYQYLQTKQSKVLLRILKIIVHFTHRTVVDLDHGVMSNVDDIPLVDYSDFPIPNELKYYIIKNVIELRLSSLIETYLSVLCIPNRTDTLMDAFANAYKNYGHWYTDLDFMLWTITCCLISVELYERDFREAKHLTVLIIREICSKYNRYDTFRKFGCMID